MSTASPLLPTYARQPLTLVEGKGARVTADDGRSYIDFGAGIAVNALGHAHPHLIEALTAQATRMWHCSNLYHVPGQEKLARRLVEASFADLVFFANSGAEAIECAIKMARKYHAHKGAPERFRLVTFEGAFHGRTLATIAAGGQVKYLDGFGPKVDGFDQVAFGDIAAVRDAVGAETAGIIIEPIQGEGGIRPAEKAFLQALRKLCDAHDLMLIYDEVQCGMGRTGRLFAHEWAGVAPDIMALAKGLGGGFPVGACLATEAAAAGMAAGSHGTTFGGNPLAMAVGNAVLDIMLEDGFLARVREAAGALNQKLSGLIADHGDVVEAVRGEGLMLGLKCKVENVQLVAAAREEGLLTVGAGENVVRLLPPLVVTDADIDEAVVKLDAACRRLAPSPATEKAAG